MYKRQLVYLALAGEDQQLVRVGGRELDKGLIAVLVLERGRLLEHAVCHLLKVALARQKGNAQRGNQLAFGSFGIKALETKWITGRQIEAARIAVTRYMQRQGQIWIRIFPDKPITRKPADVRMGKGKGAPEGFVAPVTPGRIIIEAEGVSYEIAKEALRLAAQKLPITTKFVVRRDYDIQNQNA